MEFFQSSEEVSVLEYRATTIRGQDEIKILHGNPFKTLQAVVVHHGFSVAVSLA